MEKPKCLSQHLEASMLWAGAEKILSIPGARTPQPLHSHKTGLGSHGGNPCQLSMPACWCRVGWRLWVLGLHTAPRAFCTAVGWELLLSELIPLAGGVRMKCSGWQVWRHNHQWIVPCKDHKQDLKKTAASPVRYLGLYKMSHVLYQLRISLFICQSLNTTGSLMTNTFLLSNNLSSWGSFFRSCVMLENQTDDGWVMKYQTLGQGKGSLVHCYSMQLFLVTHRNGEPCWKREKVCKKCNKTLEYSHSVMKHFEWRE